MECVNPELSGLSLVSLSEYSFFSVSEPQLVNDKSIELLSTAETQKDALFRSNERKGPSCPFHESLTWLDLDSYFMPFQPMKAAWQSS